MCWCVRTFDGDGCVHGVGAEVVAETERVLAGVGRLTLEHRQRRRIANRLDPHTIIYANNRDVTHLLHTNTLKERCAAARTICPQSTGAVVH